MHVSVDVTMKQGHITEWFPQYRGLGSKWRHALGRRTRKPRGPSRRASAPGRSCPWSALRPRAFGSERLVLPHRRPAAPATPVPPPDCRQRLRPLSAGGWEKFIFYRGAGDELPPYRVEAPAASVVRLSHYGDGAGIQAAFLLEIGSRGARWARLNPLPEMTGNQGAPFVECDLNIAREPIARRPGRTRRRDASRAPRGRAYYR